MKIAGYAVVEESSSAWGECGLLNAIHDARDAVRQ